MEKSFLPRDLAVIIELVRRDVLDDGQVPRARAQVLAHGDDFAADFTQIIHRLKKLGFFLAKTEHNAALRHNAGR